MEEPVTVPAIAAPGKVAPLPQPWEEKVSRSSGETYSVSYTHLTLPTIYSV